MYRRKDQYDDDERDNKLLQLCSDFSEIIREMEEEEWTREGGRVVFQGKCWKFILIPTEAPPNRDSILQLLTIRQDLVVSSLKSETIPTLMTSVIALARWLSLRGYTVGLEGLGLWDRFRLLLINIYQRVFAWRS